MRKKKGTKKRSVRVNFENFIPPSHLDVIEEIRSKVGNMPKMSADLPKGKWSEQALKVLSERYLRKNLEGEVIETAEEMCWRVSWEVASAEARWGKNKKQVKAIARSFYNLLVSREFLPNSPTLMNAGTGNGLQYSACFVLPVEDSLHGIFDAIKYQALIHQTGGGTGFSFSRLRPKGSVVKSSGGVASGPVSFMRIFDSATNEIKQGGKRRGANMGILRVDHPDIMEFIACKKDGGITNFNISVAITDKFMKALKSDEDYDLVSIKTNDKKKTEKKVVGKISARKVWDSISELAWETGDPGIVFIDRRNKGASNPVPALGPIEATNPCGEQELYSFDACNLGSIFLGFFVKKDDRKKTIDWEKLEKTTRQAVRFLDNVIEVNPFPLDQIRKTVFAIRRIGLGVGGWADLLVEMGIPYNSRKAIALAKKVMKTIHQTAVDENENLAEERGPFPLWHQSIYKKGKKRRNSTVTTIAPTGSISIIAGASSGIEPLFAIAYQHVVKDKSLDRTLSFINPKLEKIARKKGFWSDQIIKQVSEKGVIGKIADIPKDVRRVFVTAHEIDSSWHVKMQAAFQKYTDNAVSKTINLKHNATSDEVRDAYLLAWETQCKGITVFRDGCKDAQVLNLGLDNKKKDSDGLESVLTRPFVVKGATYRLDTPVGTAFITINENQNGEPLELFINIGKAGSDVAAMAEALGRTISTTLRFKSSMQPKERAKEIALQLAGIGGRRSVGFGMNKVLSLPDAIALALSRHFNFKVNGFLQESGSSLSKTDNNSDGSSLLPNGNLKNGKNNQELGLKNGDSLENTKNISITTPHLEDGSDRLLMKDTSFTQIAITDQTRDICPSCGASSFVYQEGCAKCYSCFYSEC